MDGLEDAFGLDTIEYLEVGRVIHGNGTTGATLHNIQSDAGSDVDKVKETGYAAIETSPDGFDSCDTEEEWMHQPEDVESHLFCRERPGTVRPEFLGHRTGGTRRTGVKGPSGREVRKAVKSSFHNHIPNDDTGKAEIFTPVLGVLAVEGFQRNLGL